MTKITPSDIQQQQFKIKFRGFDIQEVDVYLEKIADAFESLINENQKIREKIDRLNLESQGYKKREEIFKSKGCIFCHKLGRSSGTIPSLPDLAKAYKGKQKQLVMYLNGEAGPIVNPERAGTMKRQIEKTKAMSDSDRTALADFMLRH